MATLYITEYENVAEVSRGAIPVALSPALASQTVAIGGTSTQSSAFNVLTRYIRVHTDAICSFVVSASPTATTANKRLPADATEYFGVPVGQSFKVAVIANT